MTILQFKNQKDLLPTKNEPENVLADEIAYIQGVRTSTLRTEAIRDILLMCLGMFQDIQNIREASKILAMNADRKTMTRAIDNMMTILKEEVKQERLEKQMNSFLK